MAFSSIPYGICAAAYAILLALLLTHRNVSYIGKVFCAACIGTIGWATVGTFAWILPTGSNMVAGSISDTLWLLFIGTLPGSHDPSNKPGWRHGPRAAVAPLVGILVVGLSLVRLNSELESSLLLWQVQLIGRLVMAVIGISLIENFYRNAATDQRWAIIPLCIALGSMFAFELYLFSDALLLRHSTVTLAAAAAVIDTIAVPLLVVSTARNASWQIPIRVSRDAAFHGVTLLASGFFLISVALIGSLFRKYGGEWSLILQVSLLFGSATVLAVVLSSGTAKSHIRNLILKNFFQYRYDYRIEWVKFIETLSSNEGVVDLRERVIRSMGDVVDSPGGALFQRQDSVYFVTACWNVKMPATAREPENSEFMAGFQNGTLIQELNVKTKSDASAKPIWMTSDRFWLAVPLIHKDQLTGFVLLTNPRGPFALDWEVTDLMRIAARQAASYLAEQEAAAALADAQKLEVYSKRFAFVVHDIKNLSNQLALIVSNARSHGEDPEFRADLMLTIQNAVARMNKLLAQLKMREGSATSTNTNVANAMGEVVSAHPMGALIRAKYPTEQMLARIDPASLYSILSHLVENAVQASSGPHEVSIEARMLSERVVIDVSDHGSGMDMTFVRDRLFRPFETTKDGGYGIGAFQTRELIRSAGGRLEVLSTPGSGTIMRIILMAAKLAAPAVSVE